LLGEVRVADFEAAFEFQLLIFFKQVLILIASFVADRKNSADIGLYKKKPVADAIVRVHLEFNVQVFGSLVVSLQLKIACLSSVLQELFVLEHAELDVFTATERSKFLKRGQNIEVQVEASLQSVLLSDGFFLKVKHPNDHLIKTDDEGVGLGG